VVVDEVELRGRLEALEWTETDYISPHEYVLRSEAPELYDLIDLLKRSEGYREKFGGRFWWYFDVGGYKYWTVDDGVACALNRVALEDDPQKRLGSE